MNAPWTVPDVAVMLNVKAGDIVMVLVPETAAVNTAVWRAPEYEGPGEASPASSQPPCEPIVSAFAVAVKELPEIRPRMGATCVAGVRRV